MASAAEVVEMLKAFWDSQVNDDEQRAFNYRVLKAGGIFGVSILLMRTFGDQMNV